MVDLDEAIQSVVDELRAGGVRAVGAAEDVQPPCVLVRPPTIHFRYAKATYSADFEAWAIVGKNGQTNEFKAVGDLITATQTALAGRVVTGTPDDLPLPDGGTASMYRLTWTQKIPA